MSSIKLSPNASGTGIFTIAAPNSNTDRTLTLPDQTGTILSNAGPFTANASASNGAVTIDASNNVGIGTSSPAVRLQIDGGSTQELQRFNTTNTAPFVGWYTSGTRKAYQQWDASVGWILDSEAASTGVVLRTQNTARLTVDASGFVKMPFQPAFHATRDTAFNAGSGVIVFPTTVTNIGSGYNNSTGRFTAPVAGTYLIMTSFFTNIANAPIDFRINVNGGNVGGNATTGTTAVTRDCHAYIVYTLAVNDYVTIEAAGFGTNIPSGLGIFQTFSGHLIG